MCRPTMHRELPLCVALCAAVASAPAMAQLKTQCVLIVSERAALAGSLHGCRPDLLDVRRGMWESADSLKKRFWMILTAERPPVAHALHVALIASRASCSATRRWAARPRDQRVAYSYPATTKA